MTLTPTIWTIGHSTRTEEEFVALLSRHGITRLVDVRSYPGSRRCPWFGKEDMASWLAANEISYTHLVALGGRRPVQREISSDLNAAWRLASFKNYADYTLTDQFSVGITTLEDLARDLSAYGGRVVYMCSEAVPWRCHRLLLSNSLAARGWNVRHIMDKCDHEHQLGEWGPEPVITKGRNVIYPAQEMVAV